MEFTLMEKSEDLIKRVQELESELQDKEDQIRKLKESEMALADANVRIAELFMDLEDAQEQIIDQKNEIQQQNEELNEHLEELSLINEQLNIAQTLNENLHRQQIQADIIKRAHNRILSSIHYAQNIQKSILPSSSKIKNIFPKYFKHFIPKDLVGGDFYWVTQIGNKDILIVGDCTGHGVPGAFMTLIGISLIERIVNVLKVTDPSEVLKELNKLINQLLVQKNIDCNRDSIDMSIFVLDKTTNKVIISSAKRNFIRVGKDRFAEQIKGCRFTVGDFSETEKVFVNQEFDVNKGDRYYFYSDGLTDQFGGPKNKKIGNKNFKNLIESIQNEQLFSQQISIENYYTEWMKDEVQIDDMVLFGIEL
ncbi:SpoIIE family protein phosphatase [Flammeovirga yaeyamensis]|uniref:SpoIIE family protein phosphatase n=1 Tax=Flammeovirga yaeyamensis TaxID=367791 RepID=A0AAX1N7M7_9BACT|nr:SpoIIE family protein phosphatase [Flammeovirga yaeyamensis]MBB3699085.1 serine phosphatase RsbU (regulator of sigma subunit) [Flammeovirga yaeyamensis]NMF36519.1 SpoIIE family protein phosphatase [Flammeovirga yaeyamensis]QWG03523.1 SpoIIE family protein phosphatase [Flammeovirga yaeyamensis]